MKDKDLTRLLAAGSLAGIFAVHWLPKRLLPFASPALAAALIIGGLLFVHRNPLRILQKDLTSLAEHKEKITETPV
jgi:hypothetical protein